MEKKTVEFDNVHATVIISLVSSIILRICGLVGHLGRLKYFNSSGRKCTYIVHSLFMGLW